MTSAKPEIVADPRHEAILAAAFRCFVQYGFRRTSMEDIAREASMSRPALYVHFRNKEDIFRSLSRHYLDLSVREVEQVLARPLAAQDGLATALENAFLAQSGKIVPVILSSAHGADLWDAGNRLCADIVAEAKARLAAAYGDFLRRLAEAGQVSLEAPPEEVARTILGAIEGVKAPPYSAYLAHLGRLARLFARGLSA